MSIVIWIVRLLLFLVLFGFAVKNDHVVTLNFFFGHTWQMPMVFVILAAFSVGAILGVTSTFGALLRNRREVGRLRREAARAEKNQRVVEYRHAPAPGTAVSRVG
jgi:lipopolysaccharide assembly protein A